METNMSIGGSVISLNEIVLPVRIRTEGEVAMIEQNYKMMVARVMVMEPSEIQEQIDLIGDYEAPEEYELLADMGAVAVQVLKSAL